MGMSLSSSHRCNKEEMDGAGPELSGRSIRAGFADAFPEIQRAFRAEAAHPPKCGYREHENMQRSKIASGLERSDN